MEAHFQFEWNETKAASNIQKHGISFELAASVFFDPNLLTVADLEQSDKEERWFSVGLASTGALLAVAYLWIEQPPSTVKIRLISARKATQTDARYHEGGS